MSATGRGAVRHELDYYETPLFATKAIVPLLGLPRRVVDLGCGGGAIGHALRLEWGNSSTIVGVEVDQGRADEARVARTADGALVYDEVEQLDVLAPLTTGEIPAKYRAAFDLVAFNPPYSHAVEFIDEARRYLRPGGRIAVLLRVGFAASAERFAWHQANPSDVHVLSRRPSFYPNNPNAKDSTEYAWFLFGLGHGGRWSVLECEASSRVRRSPTAVVPTAR